MLDKAKVASRPMSVMHKGATDDAKGIKKHAQTFGAAWIFPAPINRKATEAALQQYNIPVSFLHISASVLPSENKPF
jgi:hypothetical protein